jgi:hypothetical protein
LTKAVFSFEKDYRHRWEADADFLIRLNEVPELPADIAGRLLRGPAFPRLSGKIWNS